MREIPTPNKQQVELYLNNWDKLDNYVLQESSLKKLFTKTYPYNVELDDILIKVCCLNDFYSTNIFSPFTIAKHIKSLGVDKYLANNDLSLVDKISKIKMNGGKYRNFYSFATKYCSHHKPETYPIYDSFVDKVLVHFRKRDNFYDFSNNDLKNYQTFNGIVSAFISFYSLDEFGVKDIDKYLWQLGKDYFPKNYK